MGDWKVIIPQAATNMVLNPVAQGVGNYAAITTAAVTVDGASADAGTYLGYQHFEASGTADNSGISFTLGALANSIHYVTMRTYGAVSAWDWSLDNSTWNAPTNLRIEGDWYVYGFEFPAAQANTSTTLYVQKNGAGDYTWYIGHLQVESGSVETTPITGDIKGFCSDGYYWNGTPHASTSTRAAKERKGGLIKDLATDYNFKVRYGVGVGMPPLTHFVQGMALLPGALYEGYKVEPRVLDLVSIPQSNTAAGVSAARKNFINAIKPDRVSPNQPVVLRYSGANANRPIDFYAIYDSGLEFQTTSGVTEKPEARFICYDPFCYEVHDESESLVTHYDVANANYCVRYINGSWANIATGFDNTVSVLERGLDGCIYLGGVFTTTGLADHDHYIAKWNPYTSTMSVLGTGLNAYASTIITAPNGDIYVGGDFSSAGGVAETDKLAYWDISDAAWKSVTTTHPGAVVLALAINHSGNMYVGGAFTDLGAATGDYIALFTFGTGWSSLSTGTNGQVNCLAIAPNGDLYAGGFFTTAGGTTVNGVAKWNGTAWSALGTGLSGGDAYCYALAFDNAGNLYVGGNFTGANGVSCANIAKWNGSTFEALGAGVNNTCYSLAIDDNGLVYAGGIFTSAGGITIADRVAVWNGTTWNHLDIDLPGTPGTYAILTCGTDLYLGYTTAGTAVVSNLNAVTVTANNSTSAYPKICISRSGGTSATIAQIKNVTTGDCLYLDYGLLDGETLTIDLTQGDKKVISNYFALHGGYKKGNKPANDNLLRAILRNSDLGSFCLLPGTNNLSIYVVEAGSPTMTAWIEYKRVHWAADMVAA